LPAVTYCDVQGGFSGEGNIDADPLFIHGPWGRFYLEQMAAGQDENSPCVDAGDRMITGPCLSHEVCGTTRTDFVPDAGIIDMGYHYPLSGLQFPPGSLIDEIPGDGPQIQKD
jgi:hypothetical protein